MAKIIDTGVRPLQKEDITVDMFDEAIKKANELKEKHARMKNETSEVWHEYEETLLLIKRYCDVLEKTEFKSTYGNFSFKYEEGFSLPKDIESKQAFLNYLKEKDMYDALVTVNAKSLDSFCKAEMAQAEDEGDFEFVPPGIIRRDPRLTFKLSKPKK